ncbi:hypothetical protein M011DRAFT_349437 [Sporormia fimetaria CBS 119925]|uniref:Uncharacterized protein n=1 Tax=Sporormia fimetaria CBS 119925 TaxID=1340428 RepID=A0A6A6VCU0_9PLEO|nr:hypothetical protein M011DRAFT_349437 [Sporormia fimetaria CBS 119925]
MRFAGSAGVFEEAHACVAGVKGWFGLQSLSKSRSRFRDHFRCECRTWKQKAKGATLATFSSVSTLYPVVQPIRLEHKRHARRLPQPEPCRLAFGGKEPCRACSRSGKLCLLCRTQIPRCPVAVNFERSSLEFSLQDNSRACRRVGIDFIA